MLSRWRPLFADWILAAQPGGGVCEGRRAALTVSFDCDHRADVRALPRLLDMLRAANLRAAFACVGRWVEEFPEEHGRIVSEGHEILNHSHTHPDNEELCPERRFRDLGPGEKREEIASCHAACREVLGVEPRGFRAPHFGSNFSPEDYALLRDFGYVYSSSAIAIETASLGAPFRVEEGLWEFPLSPCPRHPFSIFDSWHTTSPRSPEASHADEPDFERWFRTLVELAIRNRAYVNVYFDPQDVVLLGRFPGILQWLASRRDELVCAPYAGLVTALEDRAAAGAESSSRPGPFPS